MTVEKLTEDQQHRLMDLRIFVPTVTDALLLEKVLRIIDQLTAALEAAERDGAETYDRLMTAHDRQHARAEALQARVAELEGKRLAQESAILTLAAKNIGLDGRARAVESELAQMRVRVEAFLEPYAELPGVELALEALRGR